MYPDIRRLIEDIPALNRVDADRLADRIFDLLIPALQRSPAFPPHTYCEWTIVLADTHAEVSAIIHRQLCGYGPIDQLVYRVDEECV
jgi:hypothetical protein